MPSVTSNDAPRPTRRERLRAELEKYKAMVASMQNSGGPSGDSDAMKALQDQLEQARAALNSQVQNEGTDNSEQEALKRQASF